MPLVTPAHRQVFGQGASAAEALRWQGTGEVDEGTGEVDGACRLWLGSKLCKLAHQILVLLRHCLFFRLLFV